MWSCARKQVKHCVHDQTVTIVDKTAEFAAKSHIWKVRKANKSAMSLTQDGRLQYIPVFFVLL